MIAGYVMREELKSGAMLRVMRYLLEYQAASYEPLDDEQKVFLWLAQSLNSELRIRNPHRNKTLWKELQDFLLDVMPPRRVFAKPRRVLAKAPNK